MKNGGTSSGFTIIEAMIALAISTVVLMAMLGMFSSSMKSQKYLSQKYAVLDLTALIRVNLIQPNFCSCNFPTPLNFSSKTIPVTTLNSVPSTSCAPITDVVASSVPPNNAVPGLSSGLKIQSMQMQNIHLISAISPSSNLYSIDLEVAFDPKTSAYAIKPLVVSGLTATTSVSGTSETITSCGINGSVPLPGPSPPPPLSSPPPVTVAQMCVALGGTFTAPSGPCKLPAGDAPGGVNPLPTATPKTVCAAATTMCAGKPVSIPEITDRGSFNRDWIEIVNGQNSRCQLHVACSGTQWNANVCNCLAIK